MRIFYVLMLLIFGMGVFPPCIYGGSTVTVEHMRKQIEGKAADASPYKQEMKAGKDWEKYKKYEDDRIVYLHTPYFTCSGALMSSHIVLTANHCVWATDQQKIDPRLIDVYIGGTNSGNKTRGVRIITEATRKFDGASKDYAIIVLEKDISLHRYFTVTSSVRACDGEIDVYVLGFPGKRGKGNPWKSEGRMGGESTERCDMYATYSECNSPDCSLTTARVEPGSSGSPVFSKGNPDRIIGLVSQTNKKRKHSAIISGPLEAFYNAHRNEPIDRF